MTRPRPLVVAAEVCLAAVSLAAVLGMSRLFDGGGWLGPLVVNAAAAHVVAAALRRRGTTLPVAGLVMAAGATLVGTWTLYWSTTTVGLPTGATWSAMQGDLGEAWRLYQDVEAPAPVAAGFVLASCIAVWCVAYVADWAAFRLWVPFEATLPAATLVLFTALLGTDRGRTWSVSIFAAAVLAFLLVHRMARQESSSHWVADRRALGQRSLLMAGAGLGLVAVVAGLVLGPTLPGAGSPAVFDPTAAGRDGGRRVISPLVDIKARLVNQSSVEMFTVQSTHRAYWRLTSLERFDGRLWTSSGTYRETDGQLPESVEADVDVEPIEQTFTIEALAAIWLPSAFEPRSLQIDDATVRYDEESSTLIVDDSLDDSDSLEYVVTSASPRLAAEDVLTGVDRGMPEEIADTYLDLPDDFSPRVRALAQELTAGTDGPADAARALQDHLQTFEYSLDAPDGHSDDVLEEFLFETQVGYCEQFAGSFAAMARAIGVPARVAVGFTPGEEDPDVPGLYHVRGEYAHAWPEVYLDGVGWVAFEPTPGRGMPGAEAYTGVPEAQAVANEPGASVTLPPRSTETLPGPGDGPTGASTPDPDLGVDAGGAPSSGGGDTDSAFEAVANAARQILPVALGGAALVLLVVPLWSLLRRARRRRLARTSLARVRVAWSETVEEATTLVGYDERPSDTIAERARQLAHLVPAAETEAIDLGRHLETAVYTPGGVNDDDADAAAAGAAAVRAALRASASRRARLRRWISPRVALDLWRRGRRQPQRRITLTPRADLDRSGARRQRRRPRGAEPKARRQVRSAAVPAAPGPAPAQPRIS